MTSKVFKFCLIQLWLIQLHQAQFDVNVWGVVRMLQGGKYILINKWHIIRMSVRNYLQYWNFRVYTVYYSIVLRESSKLL